MAFLDKTGLEYLWTKILAKIGSKMNVQDYEISRTHYVDGICLNWDGNTSGLYALTTSGQTAPSYYRVSEQVVPYSEVQNKANTIVYKDGSNELITVEDIGTYAVGQYGNGGWETNDGWIMGVTENKTINVGGTTVTFKPGIYFYRTAENTRVMSFICGDVVKLNERFLPDNIARISYGTGEPPSSGTPGSVYIKYSE